MRAAVVGIVVFVVVVASNAVSPHRAWADPPTCGEAPSDFEVQRRLDILSTAIAQEEPAVRRWYTTFGLLHASMMSLSIIMAATAQAEGNQYEMIVGAISSALGFTTLMIFTPPLMGAGDSMAALPEDTPAQRLAKMRYAEDALSRAAASINFMQGWFPTTGTALYITAAASTLLLAFDRLSAAYTNIVGGVVLGFGRIMLRPAGARGRWQRYQRAHPDADCDPPEASDSAGVNVQVVPYGLGLGLHMQF